MSAWAAIAASFFVFVVGIGDGVEPAAAVLLDIFSAESGSPSRTAIINIFDPAHDKKTMGLGESQERRLRLEKGWPGLSRQKGLFADWVITIQPFVWALHRQPVDVTKGFAMAFGDGGGRGPDIRYIELTGEEFSFRKTGLNNYVSDMQLWPVSSVELVCSQFNGGLCQPSLPRCHNSQYNCKNGYKYGCDSSDSTVVGINEIKSAGRPRNHLTHAEMALALALILSPFAAAFSGWLVLRSTPGS